MTATFKVFSGELKCHIVNNKKQITQEQMENFWSKAGCGQRRGVYIFGYRSAKGYKPLYVGQTKLQSFAKRIGQHLSSNKFDSMIERVKKGTPILILVSRVGSGRNSTKAIDELELDFINHAFLCNKNLYNDRGYKKPLYKIDGYKAPGRPAKPILQLKKMVGL